MKLWIVIAFTVSVLAGCDKQDKPYQESTGAGGAGPGYDGTGSGPTGTNINKGTETGTNQ